MDSLITTHPAYRTPLAGGEITYIEVTAWRSQRIALYQLEDWLKDPNWLDRLLGCDDCRKAPEIKPALSETYWLLEDLEIPGAVVYQPSFTGALVVGASAGRRSGGLGIERSQSQSPRRHVAMPS